MPDARAALRKQAQDAGVIDTGQYVEWLEDRLLERLADEPRDEEGSLP